MFDLRRLPCSYRSTQPLAGGSSGPPVHPYLIQQTPDLQSFNGQTHHFPRYQISARQRPHIQEIRRSSSHSFGIVGSHGPKCFRSSPAAPHHRNQRGDGLHLRPSSRSWRTLSSDLVSLEPTFAGSGLTLGYAVGRIRIAPANCRTTEGFWRVRSGHAHWNHRSAGHG